MQQHSPHATPLPLLVDLKGLSKLVPLSVSTLRKCIKSGMPHLKPGGKILIDPQDALEWFKGTDSDQKTLSLDVDARLDEILRDLD